MDGTGPVIPRPPRVPLTRARTIALTLLVAVCSLVVSLVGVAGSDVYLHHRAERYAGVNIWGYRGSTVPRKRPGEHRLVVLGGSTAFGYGVSWDEAFPAQLEADLRPLLRVHAPLSVVNLGYNSQGAYSFKFALDDFLGLDYDAAILYEGYNDLGDGPNYFVARRDSPIFRLTGYYPILPLYLREKAMAVRAGGDLAGAYRGKVVFKPGLAARSTAQAFEAAAKIGFALSDQLDRFARSSKVEGDGWEIQVSDVGCGPRWRHYCGAVYDGVQFALEHQKKVLVVTQPYAVKAHEAQQAALRSMLDARFGTNPNVKYVNLGPLIDLKDSRLQYDAVHLTAAGNAIVAADLVPTVVALMPEAFRPAP